MKIGAGSPWTKAEVEAFLKSYRAPIRLAANGSDGHPTVCSLWFHYEDGRIACATQATARIARLLDRDARCAFELAPNEPPYRGVRGRGRAVVSREGASTLLGELIDRYLGDRESKLGRWLLGRAADEVAIRIEVEHLSAWDYSERMSS